MAGLIWRQCHVGSLENIISIELVKNQRPEPLSETLAFQMNLSKGNGGK